MSQKNLNELYYYRGVKVEIYEIHTPSSNNTKSYQARMNFQTLGVDREEVVNYLNPFSEYACQYANSQIDDFLRAWSVSTSQTHVLELKMKLDPSKPIIKGANDFVQIAKALNKVIEVNIKGMWMLIGPNNTAESVRKNYYRAVLNMANTFGVKDLFEDERNEEKPLSMY